MQTEPQAEGSVQLQALHRRRRFGVFAITWGTISALVAFAFTANQSRFGLPILPLVFMVWGFVRLAQVGSNNPHPKLTQNVSWTPMEVLLVISAVLVSVGLVVAVCDPVIRRSAERPGNPISPGNSRVACIANLKIIQASKEIWMEDQRKTPNDVPLDSDLFGPPPAFISRKPTCPAGGSYSIGKVGEKAVCSVPGHTL